MRSFNCVVSLSLIDVPKIKTYWKYNKGHFFVMISCAVGMIMGTLTVVLAVGLIFAYAHYLWLSCRTSITMENGCIYLTNTDDDEESGTLCPNGLPKKLASNASIGDPMNPR
jgi:MFS superfamily sulfate permease-like transporter